jgi:hypothetical protein
MAAQKATDIRRVLSEVQANAQLLREREGIVESQLIALPAADWPDAVARVRYVLNLYASTLAATDTRWRELVIAVLADFDRLSDNG